ncbi:Protein of unknown function DUF86 [Frankia torreyi]|uniref:Uncharacterized protein n=1 Tax=Frankia torreyi TaxID=1856 RepID=A0A0D8BCD8_9ACTN|nr:MULTISPECIES: HepT-like ribonuclease domain-containing protein [Frankia]KJE21720.1 Protein of unknown function DUF86 [Frankia torreyi]KQC36531.1 hypothetical protein UK82_20105 [Frankia sp. ACN1ag]KQM03267.1 Protein of unknown function DUF86 [Frankia sp. CpI1-P]
MRRDVLLLGEMIEAADQAQRLTEGITIGDLEADRQRRDALLWNFTVLGEAASQLSDEGWSAAAWTSVMTGARSRPRMPESQ